MSDIDMKDDVNCNVCQRTSENHNELQERKRSSEINHRSNDINVKDDGNNNINREHNESNSSIHINSNNNGKEQQSKQKSNNNHSTYNSNKQTQPSQQYNNTITSSVSKSTHKMKPKYTSPSSFTKPIPFHPQLYPLPIHKYLKPSKQTTKQKEMHYSTSISNRKQTIQREPTQKEMTLYLRKYNKQYSSHTKQKQFNVMNTLNCTNNGSNKRYGSYVCKGNGNDYMKVYNTQRSSRIGGNEEVPLMYKYFKRRLEKKGKKKAKDKGKEQHKGDEEIDEMNIYIYSRSS